MKSDDFLCGLRNARNNPTCFMNAHASGRSSRSGFARPLLTRVALYGLVLSLAALLMRWIWILANVAEYIPLSRVGTHSASLYLSTDLWASVCRSSMLLCALILGSLAARPWRCQRHAMIARCLSIEDRGTLPSLRLRIALIVLWLPPLLLPFGVGILIAKLAEFDPQLWPLDRPELLGSAQQSLVGGGGVLRGQSGVLRWIGQFLWVHPLTGLGFWSVAGLLLILVYRWLIGWPRERRSREFRDMLWRCGRCPECRYAIRSNARACSECGASLP